MVYKIIHNFTNLDPSDFFVQPDPRSRAFASEKLKYLNAPINNTVSGFFAYRVIPFWNYLPPEVRAAKSLNSFKTKIRSLPCDKIIFNSLIRF